MTVSVRHAPGLAARPRLWHKSGVGRGGVSAPAHELETLCRSCGLCCDGTLFGCASLDADEVQRARKTRLRVLPRETAFEQPCTALSSDATDRACVVYTERPRACRAFTCRLRERHRHEGGPLAARLEAVTRVRELLRLLHTTTEEDARRAATEELAERTERDFARATTAP